MNVVNSFNIIIINPKTERLRIAFVVSLTTKIFLLDAVHTLVCALMLLNTDLHGEVCWLKLSQMYWVDGALTTLNVENQRNGLEMQAKALMTSVLRSDALHFGTL